MDPHGQPRHAASEDETQHCVLALRDLAESSRRTSVDPVCRKEHLLLRTAVKRMEDGQDIAFDVPVGVVDYLHRPVRRERHVYRLEEALREVMERLPLAAVFDRAPRGDWPVVVQLPEQGAHAARLFRAPGVDGHLDRHRLLELREQELRGDVLRLAEIALEVLADAAVASVVLLVPLEVGSAREDLLLRGERLGDLQRRKRLVAELGAEARVVVVVFRERRVLVPHVPVVHVALRVLLPAVAEVAGATARRGRPVGARGVVFPHELALHLRALDPFAAVEVGVGARLLKPLDRA